MNAYSDPQMHGKSLNDFPNELVAMILNEMNCEDLQNIRLVTRKLYLMATPRFATAYFTHLKVFMSISSLDTLVAICENRTFGPYVTSINFASQRLLRAPERLTTEHTYSYNTYIDRYQEQVDISKSGEALGLVCRALEALKHHPNTLSLGLVDEVWNMDAEGTLGSVTFGQRWLKHYRRWKWWECVRSGTLRLLLAAVYQSGNPLDSLSINFETWEWSCSSTNPEVVCEDLDKSSINLVDNFPQGALTGILYGLRSFDLTLLNSYFDWIGSTPASIAHILELAVNLEVLRIDVGSASYQDFNRLTAAVHWGEIEAITRAVSSTVLQEVHMIHCMLPETELVDMLSNKSKLRVLSFTNCCIGWRGLWSKLLSTLLTNNSRLDYVSLTDLYSELPLNGRYFPVNLMVGGNKEFDGNNLNAELQNFVEELQLNGF